MTELLLAYTLLVTRVAAFLAFGPLRYAVPGRFVRFGLAVALSIAWWSHVPALAADLRAYSSVFGVWILLAAREALLGWAVAFVASLYLLPAQFAGDLVGRHMGINLGQIADPVTSVPLALVPQLFQLLAIAIFFAADAHHGWVLLLNSSVARWSEVGVGPFQRPDRAALGLQYAFDNGVAVAGLLVLVGIAILAFVAVLARAMPSFNYFSIGLGTQILGGLVALYIFAPAIARALVTAAANWSAMARQLLGL